MWSAYRAVVRRRDLRIRRRREGWSDDDDLNKAKLDVQQIVDYAKQKNVGVILWSAWYAITRDTEGLLDQISCLGNFLRIGSQIGVLQCLIGFGEQHIGLLQ